MIYKNIILVANSAFTILNFRSELIKKLINKGFTVYVITPRECSLLNGKDVESEFNNLQVKFIPISLDRKSINPLKNFYIFINLFKAYIKIKPGYVLNYTIKLNVFSSVAAYLAGVPHVFSNITGVGYALSSNSFYGSLIRKIVFLLYRISLNLNSLVFFQNTDDKQLFLKNKLVYDSKCVVINGSGVDTSYFIRNNELPTSPSFIFVGRLLRDKGIYEFIEAAKLIKHNYPDVKFSILGHLDDNPESLSKYELDKLVSENVVDYLGSVSCVKSVLGEYQVLVLPSYREGTPRVVLEAMSMSMPIITTDVPGCRQTIVDGYNGFLVQAKDHIDLSNKMELYLFDPYLAKSQGLNSRKIAIERYDVNLIVNDIFKYVGI